MSNAIEKLRQSRTADGLAREIEPLAQSMATLADDLRVTMEQSRNEASKTFSAISERIEAVARSLEMKSHTLQAASDRHLQNLQSATESMKGFGWRQYLLSILVGMLAGIIVSSAFIAWQAHNTPQVVEKQALAWNNMVTKLLEGQPSEEKNTVRVFLGYLPEELPKKTEPQPTGQQRRSRTR